MQELCKQKCAQQSAASATTGPITGKVADGTATQQASLSLPALAVPDGRAALGCPPAEPGSVCATAPDPHLPLEKCRRPQKEFPKRQNIRVENKN